MFLCYILTQNCRYITTQFIFIRVVLSFVSFDLLTERRANSTLWVVLMGNKKEKEGTNATLGSLDPLVFLAIGLLRLAITPSMISEVNSPSSLNGNDIDPIRRVTTVFDVTGQPRLRVVSLGERTTKMKIYGYA